MRRLIAEIGSANGDIQYAMDACDAFHEAGAWAVKGQLYTADTLVTRDAAPYGKGLSEPATQHEAFTNALTYDEWGIVAEYCDTSGIRFFGSVFDSAAVDAGVTQNWPAYKIASADITYRALLEAVAATGVHTFLSTGAASGNEILQATDLFSQDLTVMACTLSYPCPLPEANVARISTLKELYESVGYSDHTRGLVAADYAYRIGADYVEKHVTLTPGEGGDHNFAIGTDDVRRLVEGDVETTVVGDALVAGDPWIGARRVEYLARHGARRSWTALTDLVPGELLTVDNVGALRPGAGIVPWIMPASVKCFVAAGTQLQPGMVE